MIITEAEKINSIENNKTTRIISADLAIISGKVYYSDGSPRTGLTVKAFDRNIGADDTLLGEAVTDKLGSYSISYSLNNPGGKSSADLVICVYQDTLLLQTSDVIFNARMTETKDFAFSSSSSTEYHYLLESIKPLLHHGSGISNLAKDQIDILSQKTGIDRQKIERLVKAEKLSNKNEILSAFYYGLLSENFPVDPPLLRTPDRSLIISALHQAELRNVIPVLTQQEINYIFDIIVTSSRRRSS
jgi:hypothetical protein